MQARLYSSPAAFAAPYTVVGDMGCDSDTGVVMAEPYASDEET
jgi:hypothetical protein